MFKPPSRGRILRSSGIARLVYGGVVKTFRCEFAWCLKVPTAFYFDYTRGHHGSTSFVGGQPTHLPVHKPWPAADDQHLGFVLQLAVDGKRLDVPDVDFVQLYQPIDDGDDPTPHLVLVPARAPRNLGHSVLQNPFVDEWDIDFRLYEDPAVVPTDKSLDTAALFKSKLGGTDPWGCEDELILQIAEGVVGFNFGGTMCSIYRHPDNSLFVRMN